MIQQRKDGSVTVISIARPEVRNAVDRATAQALAEAFVAFEQDDAAQVGVLSGDQGAFCAGADLKAVAAGAEPGEGDRANRVLLPSGERLDFAGPMGPSRMLLSKPVIAAIAGYAVAGGLELALWCDLRVAEQDAVLGVFCRRWGVPLVDGGTIRLPRLIGHARAMDLILTGRAVGADEALAMGLVNRVVPVGTALDAAVELAHEIARFPQGCMRSDRLSAYEQWDLDYAQALVNEYQRGQKVMDSGETKRGAARFAAGKGRGGDFDNI